MPDALVASDVVQDVERTGREIDFGKLYGQLFPRVLGYIYKKTAPDVELAEDLAAEAFTRALEKLETLREPYCVGAWVMTIAKNLANSHWRGEERKTRYMSRLVADYFRNADTGDPEAMLICEEEAVLLEAAIGRLTPREQSIVELTREGKSTREIAELLYCSEVNIRVMKGRLIVKIKHYLSANQ
ncbi:MAG: hypothetical protein A2Y57_04345 [Candidatus Woykebacteria bacterium RBG_13_40_7b]|uniref:HTH luxR-type domain-containing protein n=1 Tax=Candidatus Woykebacteria bacterium RBG_13_40_7b TaxID=1802594 RepID=A0A1G1W8C6_9BACT|nr:MAG: hypothetical protein A2Y57_04345 [Candidatus Woykebacteria bacterium RBG_13_40_7b]